MRQLILILLLISFLPFSKVAAQHDARRIRIKKVVPFFVLLRPWDMEAYLKSSPYASMAAVEYQLTKNTKLEGRLGAGPFVHNKRPVAFIWPRSVNNLWVFSTEIEKRVLALNPHLYIESGLSANFMGAKPMADIFFASYANGSVGPGVSLELTQEIGRFSLSFKPYLNFMFLVGMRNYRDRYRERTYLTSGNLFFIGIKL